MTCKLNADTSDGLKIVSDTSGAIDLQSNGTTKVSLDSSGNLEVNNGNFIIDKSSSPNLLFNIDGTEKGYIRQNANDLESNSASGNVLFRTGGTERARINTSGHLLVGTTDDEPWNNSGTNQGVAIREGGQVAMAGYQGTSLFVNRTGNDGRLVDLLQDGSTEGEITVSGSTVSYNGGHLARWGRLPTGEVDNTILKGTVMSNLDKMIEWIYADVLYTKDDELPEGKSVGDVKKAGYTAENEQRNEIKVSDVEGDVNVAGLFVSWRNDNDEYNDIGLAMTGDMVIRIAQGTTIQRGDLLMSAGDGTAKPQGDDIVRSKTIAKVISTTVIKTYDDNSYLLPCVVMAC
jgi:hypothetical protein